MTDTITVLRCASQLRLTKTHRASGTIDYDNAKWFRVEPHEVDSIHALHALLEDLGGRADACIIRGQFIGGERAAGLTYNEDPVWHAGRRMARRVAVSFRDEPVHWLSLDIDGWQGGTADPVADPEAAVEEWIAQYLPYEFHDITCSWQLSSSAGLKPGLRAHLWFWLEAPATGAQLKTWAKALSDGRDDQVDPSFFENVRIHYTADPVFEGVEDPVAVRRGLLVGMLGDAVAVNLGRLPEAEDDDDEGATDDEAEDQAIIAEYRRFKAPVGLSLDEAKEWIYALPDQEIRGYSKWLRVGQALHHEFGGSDEALAVWDQFSAERTADEYNREELEAKWPTFGSQGGEPVTMATIIAIVKRHGYAFGRCQEKLEGIANYREGVDAVSMFELSETELDTVVVTLAQLAKDSGRMAKPASIRKDIKAARKDRDESAREADTGYLERTFVEAFLQKYRRGGKERLLFHGGTFWVYRKGVWQELDKLAVKREMLDFLEHVRHNNSESMLVMSKALRESGRDSTLNALANALVELLSALCTDPLDPDPLRINSSYAPSVFNCTNGEVWVDEDGEASFTPHDPDHRLVSQLAAEYDPHADCPRFRAAMRDTFSRMDDPEDMVRHVFELFGYLAQHSREHAVWVMFHGSGSNGKSFVAGVLQALLGPEAWVAGSLASFDTAKNRHVGWGLVGKQMVLDDDAEKGALLNDGMLKKLSERKPMTADPKYGRPFNFVCRATPVMLANHWPRTRDMSHGLVRRAHIIHFNRRFTAEEMDIGLLSRILAEEMPGVLRHAIEGWQRVRRRGRFLKPASCWKAEAIWLRHRHALGAFQEDCVTVTGNHQDRVKATDLFEAFQTWSSYEGVDLRYGRNSFYEEFGHAEGVGRVIVHKTVYFSGLKLTNSMNAVDRAYGEEDEPESAHDDFLVELVGLP